MAVSPAGGLVTLKTVVKAALGSAGVLLMLAAAAAWSLFHPPWESWVVEQLSRAPGNQWPRPASAEAPLPGHFGDRFEAAWPKLQTLQDEWKANPVDADVICLEQLVHGRALGATCKRWLIKAEPVLPLVDRALASTSAGPPARFTPIRCSEPLDFPPLVTAGLAYAMDSWLLINEDRLHEATDACLSGLALARDDQWWGVPGVVSSHIEAVLLAHPCILLARAGPPEDRARLVRATKTIRLGLPDAPLIIDQVELFTLATDWAPILSDRARARMPPDVARCVGFAEYAPKSVGLKARWERYRSGTKMKTFWEVMAANAKTPPPGLSHALGSGAVLPSGWGQLHAETFGLWWASRTLPNLLDVIDETDRATTVYEQTGAWPKDLLHTGDAEAKVDAEGGLSIGFDFKPQEWSLSDGGVVKATGRWTLHPPRVLDASER